jgi:hypothetical protein
MIASGLLVAPAPARAAAQAAPPAPPPAAAPAPAAPTPAPAPAGPPAGAPPPSAAPPAAPGQVVVGTTDRVGPPPARDERPPRLDHEHQTGLAVMPGIGYKVIVPYEENIVCGDSSGDDSKRVCTNGVPLFLDLQLAFGISTRIDLIADIRLGLAKDRVTQSRQFALMPGIRIWLDPDLPFKFYTTLQAMYDSTNQRHPRVSDADFGIRNSNGFMYDPIRNVGFYFQFGDTIGFKRWFRIELDVGLGVQVRFP